MIEHIQAANNTVSARPSPNVWKCLASILFLMAGIQVVRAGLIWIQYKLFQPALASSTWVWMEIAAFGALGILLLALFRPSTQKLGLSWKDISRLEQILTVMFGVIWFGLVLTSLALSPEMLLANLQSAVLLPIFEELLFRGWIWQKLEGSLPGRYRGLLTWLANALLFSIWHLGYMDSYLLKALPANPNLVLGNLLGMKLLFTFIYGLVIGFFRWQTGRVYGSIWVHGLINLFGR